MLRDFKARLYQQTIFATCSSHNTMVVLPTGMGKTGIGLLLAARRLAQYPKSKILILAPTKPLLDQHCRTFIKHLSFDSDQLTVFSGSTAPQKRKELWQEKQVFFSTPQTIENDLISGRINLQDVSMLCFDECHRATGDYSYVFIAKQYEKQARHMRILALTASPGSDMEKINEVLANLFIEKVEIRTETDPDVKPYIQEVEKEYVYLELPAELKIVHNCLKHSFKSKLTEMKKLGYINSIENRTKTDILKLQGVLQGQIAQGDKSFELLKSVSYAAEALKVEHAIELLETQGLTPLLLYMEEIYKQAKTTKTRAVKNLANDPNFRAAYIKVKEYIPKTEHPKLEKLKEILNRQINVNPNVKIIIFSNFRDTGDKIEEQIRSNSKIKTTVFVGQAQKKGFKGMSQKKQIETLEKFKDGEFNVLIMTSVGEEGLDIPQVDTVIFYEPIPSAIRTVQRRGRTGRLEKGKVIVLMTKGTRDEGYRWSAYHKEKRMFRNLKKLKTEISNYMTAKDRDQQSINDFLDQTKKEQPLKLYADTREKGNPVIKELAGLGFSIELNRLESADYILSKDVGVEFKTIKDFVDSIVDGRLLSQIKALKKSYPRPLMILEGTEDIYSMRKVHPNAIRGMLAAITVSYGIPIIRTSHSKETASIMATIMIREQEKNEPPLNYNPHSAKPQTLKQQQEYFIGSLPNIGPGLAKELLKEFKTVKNMINASIEDLKKIEKVGKTKAAKIKDIIEREYEDK
ncbi:DEAD/DEAH box helicase [Candidatus Woesearchaeota archaeon]|nr:DEAD/DEAH box helicase [Candidatus Woesearchaeota archaeon]